MAAYFDSSVLLSLLMGDAQGVRAHELWTTEKDRVSSVLLEIECTVVLRRALATPSQRAVLQNVEKQLALALEEVTRKPLDEGIAAVVRATPGLAGCRTLDAAHLATALYFQSVDSELQVCTFDGRMAELAKRLGLAVCGSVAAPPGI